MAPGFPLFCIWLHLFCLLWTELHILSSQTRSLDSESTLTHGGLHGGLRAQETLHTFCKMKLNWKASKCCCFLPSAWRPAAPTARAGRAPRTSTPEPMTELVCDLPTWATFHPAQRPEWVRRCLPPWTVPSWWLALCGIALPAGAPRGCVSSWRRGWSVRGSAQAWSWGASLRPQELCVGTRG